MEKQRENQIKQWEKKKKTTTEKNIQELWTTKCSIRVSKIQKREDRVEHI